jgi:hypothetical protein
VSFPQQIRKKLPGGFRLGQAKDYPSAPQKVVKGYLQSWINREKHFSKIAQKA